jgi:tetratricopeptide (TPR) repeat protein
VVALAAIAACAGLAALLVARADAGASPCTGHDALLAGVWDDSRRDSLETAIADSETWTRVRPTLDTYAAAWVTESERACAATLVHGTQSAAALDRRSACLDRRKRELAALLDGLVDGGERARAHAVAAVHALPPVSDCADIERLATFENPPDDPQRRDAFDTALTRLTEARTLRRIGRLADARAPAEAALAAAQTSGHRGLVAEARELMADVLYDIADADLAIAATWEAVAAAVAAGDRVREAATWTDLVQILREAGKLDEAERVLSVSTGLATQIGDPPDVASRNHYVGGLLHMDRGRYGDAVAAMERALALLDGDPALVLRIGQIEYGFAVSLLMAGRYAEALEWARRAEHSLLDTHGPRHVNVVLARRAVADALERLGRNEEALTRYHQALSEAEALLGPDHVTIASMLANMMGSLLAVGRTEESLTVADRALSILSRAHPPEHPFVLSIRHNRAEVLRRLARYAEARAEFEALLAIRSRTQGERHPDAIDELERLGATLADLGRPADGLALVRRATELSAEVRGREHPIHGQYLVDLAITALSAAEPTIAEPAAASAVQIFERAVAPDSPELAQALRAHADALAALGRADEASARRERADRIVPP